MTDDTLALLNRERIKRGLAPVEPKRAPEPVVVKASKPKKAEPEYLTCRMCGEE